jgi:hypothetical protein
LPSSPTFRSPLIFAETHRSGGTTISPAAARVPMNYASTKVHLNPPYVIMLFICQIHHSFIVLPVFSSSVVKLKVEDEGKNVISPTFSP